MWHIIFLGRLIFYISALEYYFTFLDSSLVETVKKERRRPGRQRIIRAIIYSVHSRTTQQVPKNDSWKLTSTDTKIWEHVGKFDLLTFFSAFLLKRKVKRKKKTTFPSHPASDFALASQFTLNSESQQLSHYWNFQVNTRDKMNSREFKISLYLSFDSY